MQPHRLRILLAGPVALFLVAACGAPPTASPTGRNGGGASEISKKALQAYTEINGMTGKARLDALKAKAEKEGKLSVYTSNTDIDALVEGFSKRYKVDVTVYRGNSESVLQRVLQEQKANYYGNDIWEDNTTNLNTATNEQNLLAEYKSEFRDKVRKNGQQKNWTANRFTVFVVGWNTNLVKNGQEPKSVEELAEPKWKGKVALELSDVDWFTALYQYYLGKGKTDAEIKDLFVKIAHNAKVVKGHTVQGELLAAGQFAVAPSIYSHTVDRGTDKGAPIAWRPASGKPVEPVITRPNGAGLMKTATHPYAAMLFMDYMLSPEGQSIISDGFRVGSVEVAGKDPLAGLETITIPEQELLDNGKKWEGLYASIVTGSSPSGG
jgi:iron(III) transport system substrate-binding protein